MSAAAGSTMSVSVIVATPVIRPESAMQVAVTSGASTLAYRLESGPATQNAVTTTFQMRNDFGKDFAWWRSVAAVGSRNYEKTHVKTDGEARRPSAAMSDPVRSNEPIPRARMREAHG